MRIAICDDDANDLTTLTASIRSLDLWDRLELSAFSSAAAFYDAEREAPFDIAILDIEMPAPNGFDIAKRLVEEGRAPIILFLTQSMAYTIRGYGVAFRYLTKPIDHRQLEEALRAATREASAKQFSFCVDGVHHVIPIGDIYYFEVYDHLMVLHAANQTFRFRATLKQILSELPDGHFGSPHQSYVVHFRHIEKATPQMIHMADGSQIPISRRRHAQFDERFHSYLRR